MMLDSLFLLNADKEKEDHNDCSIKQRNPGELGAKGTCQSNTTPLVLLVITPVVVAIMDTNTSPHQEVTNMLPC